MAQNPTCSSNMSSTPESSSHSEYTNDRIESNNATQRTNCEPGQLNLLSNSNLCIDSHNSEYDVNPRSREFIEFNNFMDGQQDMAYLSVSDLQKAFVEKNYLKMGESYNSKLSTAICGSLSKVTDFLDSAGNMSSKELPNDYIRFVLHQVYRECGNIKQTFNILDIKQSLDLKALKYENAKLLEDLNKTKMKLQREKEYTFCLGNTMNTQKQQLDESLSKDNDQVEMISKLQMYKDSNDVLKKDNVDLKERCEYIEKINVDLMHKNEMQEDICKNYDDSIKIKDQQIMDLNQKLVCQTENNDKLIALQEKEKLNNDLIESLKSQNFAQQQSLNQKHKELDNFLSKMNKLENEKKNLLENHLKEMKKLEAECMEYKSKAMKHPLSVPSDSQSRLTNQTTQPSEIKDTILLISDDEENIADCKYVRVKFSDLGKSKGDFSMQSTSMTTNQNNYNIKRNLADSQNKIKKRTKKTLPK